jgi:hypothetical protein
MEPWVGYLVSGTFGMLASVLGATTFLLWTMLRDVGEEIREVRTMTVEHLRDHGRWK